MGHDKRHEKIRFLLQRRFYLGLFVFLPVFFSVFALAVPLIFLVKLKALLQRSAITIGEINTIYESAEYWMYIFTAVAFLAGLIVAYGLVRPAKRLLKDEAKDIEEFSSLGKEFTEIAASLKKYSSLLESTTGGIIALNRNGKVAMANSHACRILGCAEGDIAGKNIGELLDISGDLERALKGEVVTSESNITRDRKILTIGYTLSPIKGKEGIDGVVFNFKDITGMKEMQNEIQKTERLASIGLLAMEIAHEVRNPLASIKGLTQLIGEDIQDNNPKKIYINTILKETERLNRVVDTLFEKKTSLTTGDNLKELIHRIILLCWQAVGGKDIKVIEDHDANAANTKINDERVFHAIYNIILNAYEAVEKNGAITIKTKKTDSGTTVEVASDSKISPKITIDNIFDSDITTKGAGHGMGLKIARDAIKNIGGDISVETSDGKPKFTIKLPSTPGS